MLSLLVIFVSQPVQSIHPSVSPQPALEKSLLFAGIAASFLHILPLLANNEARRALFLSLLCFHEVASCSSRRIDLEAPYFHNLTSCFFRKCFVFTIMRVARGCALSPTFALPFSVLSLLEFSTRGLSTAHYPPLTFRNRMIAYETC
jgi:hypothetical protein